MFPATAYWLALEPGECLISNGLATMGFALPAAIAAQLVHPGRRVATTEARIEDAQGRLYAHGTSTILVLAEESR